MKGPDLWKKAKYLIPGGNQLLSKRSERFLPEFWPAYYSKAKGCKVWDINGKEYIDFAQMGVGSCILGYADDDVNKEVIKSINNSNMCTLNSPQEVQLAEYLVRLHPWSDMARFARTGGEACAIAVRIGRAASGKDKIAFCGYHGWHDWYLSSNIADPNNLDLHLLSGLSPNGVPKSLINTALPFRYNKLNELEKLAHKYGNDIGVIIMEPQREQPPEPEFLIGVRKIADNIGAVLVFDEVTSGFRMNVGGIHLTHNIYPDIAIFGKALGNGFPVSAIIGRREVMEYVQDTFISSTMWSESIGFVAALATIKKIEKYEVNKKLINLGRLLNNGWKNLARKHGVKIHIDGIPPLTHISFKQNPLLSQTYYAQEMLKKGYLLGSNVYMSFAYSKKLINKFIVDSEDVFKKLKKYNTQGKLLEYIEGDIIDTGFSRLT
tara:strand:- start:10738 stop:12042 length:1305 start_codon:yes stop_codon:yes gene_type:complete